MGTLHNRGHVQDTVTDPAGTQGVVFLQGSAEFHPALEVGDLDLSRPGHGNIVCGNPKALEDISQLNGGAQMHLDAGPLGGLRSQNHEGPPEPKCGSVRTADVDRRGSNTGPLTVLLEVGSVHIDVAVRIIVVVGAAVVGGKQIVNIGKGSIEPHQQDHPEA